MTYKSAARNIHFKAQEGSSSVRMTQRGYGGESLQGDPITILPTMREQLDVIAARIKELPALIDNASSLEEAEHYRKELAGKTTAFGDMRKVVYSGCMLARERIFVKVARSRLPENLFQSIMEEADTYWRTEGFDKLIPEPSNQEKRRANRKLSYRNWKAGR